MEGPPTSLVDYRTQIYPRVVGALVKSKQLAVALEVAKSAPESIFRDMALLNVSGGYAANGQIDEARAVMTLFSDKLDSRNRAAAVRYIAVAMVKAGKLAKAVEMAAQVGDLTGRKAVLFAIAQGCRSSARAARQASRSSRPLPAPSSSREETRAPVPWTAWKCFAKDRRPRVNRGRARAHSSVGRAADS